MSTLSQRRANYPTHWQQINNMACAICGIKPATEAELIAADMANSKNKIERSDARALAEQIRTQHYGNTP
jgi:hypothetical protein